MRGNQEQQEQVFSYVSLEQRVPQSHPLRKIRLMADRSLQEISSLFDQIYAHGGRPSIAPERLLRALMLQVLYTIRSERLLMAEDEDVSTRFTELTMDVDRASDIPLVERALRQREMADARLYTFQ